MGDFWLNKPAELLNLNIFPGSNLTDGERFNALTRLIIIITIVLFIFWRDEGHWWKFLLCGLGILILLFLGMRNRDKEFKHLD
jgi:ABC-type polysaccharide/polyol phosphate export permease